MAFRYVAVTGCSLAISLWHRRDEGPEPVAWRPADRFRPFTRLSTSARPDPHNTRPPHQQAIPMTDTPYLLDELEAADMLIIDGLHAWQFSLDEALLDQADAAAEAGQPFASEDILLTIDSVDGRTRRQWQFSYNQIMEAQRQADGESWLLEGPHQLQCLSAIAAEDEAE